MNCPCNNGTPAAAGVPAPSQAPRRTWLAPAGSLVRWAAPVAALALIPKCPACVAAYILLFTGVGLSIPAAAAVRWTLMSLSIAALALLTFRAARALLAAMSSRAATSPPASAPPAR